MNNVKKGIVFITLSAILLVLLTGCGDLIYKSEWQQAEMICKAEGLDITRLDTFLDIDVVMCSDNSIIEFNQENLYNAMIVLSKKGEL